MVEQLLPEVEIADLPLEVHGWTASTAMTLRAPTSPRVAAMMPSMPVRNGMVRKALSP